MKARIKETGEIVDVEYDDDDLYVVLGRHQYLYANEFDIISKPEEEVKMRGFLVRDKCGTLCLYPQEPERKKEWWSAGIHTFIELKEDYFPSVTWESDPLPVTITIKPKKK